MMGSSPRSLLLAAGVCLLIGCTAAALAQAPELKSAHEVVDWVLAHGGQSNARIDKSPETGLRGLFANRDIRRGDVVIAVPVNISMDIGPAQWTSAELAVSLLRVKMEYPAVWEGFQPYLSNLPGEDDVYTLYNFKQEHINLLQDAEMESFVKQALHLAKAVFSGNATDGAVTIADLKQLKPKEASQITLGELQYWASIMESYSFGAPNARNEQWRFLVPLMDMVNHNEDPNIHVDYEPARQAFVATALRDIREGEELTFEYRERSNRNDIALLHHFFLNERRPARLCAHDLPRPAQPSDMQEPFTDADYAPGGCLCTMEEAMRLVMKLSAFPTTEAQDRAALGRNRNPIRDWRERMIVEFRMLRKQSLRLTGEAITAALQASQTTSAKASRRDAVSVEDDDVVDDDSMGENVSSPMAPPVMGASQGDGGVANGGQQGEVADQSRAQGRGRRQPQVVVPLADADIGLQEPMFLKINTPPHSEL